MSSLDDALIESAQFGRWSFSLVPTMSGGFQAGNMLYAQIPSWATRSWSINLCSMQFQSGTLNPALVNVPPANQVDTFNGQYQARINWGVDGSLDTAIVDWPWGGCTICVQAAQVRVDVLANFPSDPVPILSGFLAPVPPVQTAVTAPTFTPPSAFIALSTSFRFNIPARASAYRVSVRGSTTPPVGATLVLTEEVSVATVVKFDGTFPEVAGVGSAFSQQNQAGYIPLVKEAEYVRVNNTSATIGQSVAITFLLDMG